MFFVVFQGFCSLFERGLCFCGRNGGFLLDLHVCCCSWFHLPLASGGKHGDVFSCFFDVIIVLTVAESCGRFLNISWHDKFVPPVEDTFEKGLGMAVWPLSFWVTYIPIVSEYLGISRNIYATVIVEHNIFKRNIYRISIEYLCYLWNIFRISMEYL